MSAKYFLNQNGQQLGPWTFEEILQEIENSRLQWTDYLFDEQKKDWILLLEYGPLSSRFQFWSHQQQKKSAKAPVPQTTSATAVPAGMEEWFVLKGENKYGPFGYLDLVKMLQERSVFEFDYIWTQKMKSWQRISDMEIFKPERIKRLKETGKADVAEVFFRRRYARAKYGASILLHNNTETWKGQSLELSSGGAALLIKAQNIQVGESLFLHFKAGDGVPPFTAVCSVISKRAADDGDYRYGIKFIEIAPDVQALIKKYTDRAG